MPPIMGIMRIPAPRALPAPCLAPPAPPGAPKTPPAPPALPTPPGPPALMAPPPTRLPPLSDVRPSLCCPVPVTAPGRPPSTGCVPVCGPPNEDPKPPMPAAFVVGFADISGKRPLWPATPPGSLFPRPSARPMAPNPCPTAPLPKPPSAFTPAGVFAAPLGVANDPGAPPRTGSRALKPALAAEVFTSPALIGANASPKPSSLRMLRPRLCSSL